MAKAAKSAPKKASKKASKKSASKKAAPKVELSEEQKRLIAEGDRIRAELGGPYEGPKKEQQASKSTSKSKGAKGKASKAAAAAEKQSSGSKASKEAQKASVEAQRQLDKFKTDSQSSEYLAAEQDGSGNVQATVPADQK